jgi:hypothetical protein
MKRSLRDEALDACKCYGNNLEILGFGCKQDWSQDVIALPDSLDEFRIAFSFKALQLEQSALCRLD